VDRRSRYRPSIPLVEAKLNPPAPHPGIVHRARLGRLLAADAAPPIVSIVAPPGYGKSVLLSEWAAADRRPVAWLTVDENDNDPAVFLAYLAAAFDRIEPIDGSIQTAITAPRERVLATAVPRLASEMHRWGRPALLLLDDVHKLVDRTVLDALAALLDHLPPEIQVAMAARTEPGLPFGRLRVHPGLLEIERAALAFDEGETRELVAAAGRRLLPDEARRLTERTEGWAAAIYLATLAPDREGLVTETAGDVTGRDRFIAEYLHTELLASLGDDDVAFLARTSILDPVEPAVADAVVGGPGSAERLHRLSRSYLLVERVASSEDAYRYHGLLRDHLVEELRRHEPGPVPGLHLTAAAWYAANGRHEQAVGHAMASGDVDAAARLVTRVALATLYGGHGRTLDGWLRRFDDAVFERHPSLAVIAGWIHLLNGRAAETDRMADIAEAVMFEGPPSDGSASFESSRAMLRAVMARRGPEDVLANAEFAASQEPPTSPWRANALWLVGSGRLMLGDAAGADDALAGSVAAGAAAGATSMVALATRSAIAMARGDWTAAEGLARESLATMALAKFDEIVAALLSHAVGARVALHRGDPARARELLVRAQVVRPLASHAAPWFAVGALVEMARAYLALADPAGARTVAREAREILRHRPALGTLVTELEEIQERVDAAASALSGPSTLTAAELRVLAVLPTYLSFQEIADRMFVSRNTVKTQALSIYGKLEASSRSQAVERAVELGLIDPFPGVQVARRA
jgi:LuxR family maltose regulon positive regulatory protein